MLTNKLFILLLCFATAAAPMPLNAKNKSVCVQISPEAEQEHIKSQKLHHQLTDSEDVFNIQKTIAGITSFCIGIGLEHCIASNYENLPESLNGLNLFSLKTFFSKKEKPLIRKWHFQALTITGSIATYIKILKKYNVHPLTFLALSRFGTNPIPLFIYGMYSYQRLDKNLNNVLRDYQEDEIPLCVKNELSLLIKQYKEQNGMLNISASQKRKLALEILKKLTYSS